MEGLTQIGQRTSIRVAALLVLLELVSVISLWTLNTASTVSEQTFALLLAVDLVAFAMISYTYRALKTGESAARAPMLAGCCFVLLLLFAGLFV